MNRDEQKALLTELLTRAKAGGLEIRWCTARIVVLGLPPENGGETENSTQQIPVEDRQEGRLSDGTDQEEGS